MGDVIKRLMVRSHGRERPKRLRIYFDSGSPFTFIKKSKAEQFRAVLQLPTPERFRGVGGGSFYVTQLMHLQIRILGFWCLHPAYIAEDQALGGKYDVLVGHDFMQRFNIRLNVRKRDIVADRESLEMSQIIK